MELDFGRKSLQHLKLKSVINALNLLQLNSERHEVNTVVYIKIRLIGKALDSKKKTNIFTI